MFVRMAIFAVFVVWYLVDWALHPDWGYRRVVEVGLIVVGIVLVYMIGKNGPEAYPQPDEPHDISPADRVLNIHEGSDDNKTPDHD